MMTLRCRARKSVLAILFVCFLMVGMGLADESIPARPAEWARPVTLDGVPNLHQVDERLFRSAQPNAEGMGNLKPLGIKTIVNLRAFFSDKSEIAETGLVEEHISMHAWHPEREDAVRFLQVVTAPERQPVLVHCRHGADRTGVMCAFYRVAIQGWTKQAAITEMKDGGFGFHSIWRNLPVWLEKLDVESVKLEAGINARP